jgi:hypothetical protein
MTISIINNGLECASLECKKWSIGAIRRALGIPGSGRGWNTLNAPTPDHRRDVNLARGLAKANAPSFFSILILSADTRNPQS